MDEADLIAAARTSPDAFAELYDRTFPQVYGLAYSLTSNHARAEDLVSETYRRALASFDRYEHRGHPFATWLCTITRNLVRDAARKAGREVPLLDLDAPEFIFPGAGLIAAERAAALQSALGRLNTDQRQVLVLRFGHELSCAEAAGRMNRTEAAVKQLSYRAVVRLRQILEEDGYDPND